MSERNDGHGATPDLPRVSRGALTLIALSLAALFAALFLLGWIPHARRLREAGTEARERADEKPTVQVVAPRESTQDERILLPADVRANQATALFARTSGYLKPLPDGIDIGASVREGQLLAEIAAPEVDAELEQARASLAQARAAAVRMQREYELSVTTRRRYEEAGGGAVSQQQLDEQRSQEATAAAAVEEAKANVGVAEASVKRLSDLKEFQRVVAPFAGVITARGFDAGALIAPGGAGSERELFRLEDSRTLRVQVNVPQEYATEIRPGQPAELLVRNFPGRAFAGTVARSAGAVDAATRTLPVQVDVPNPEGLLMPGMYGQVRMQRPRGQAPLVVPASAVMTGPEEARVAVLDGARARLRVVTLGRDFGAEIEVVAGLTGADQVVLNPGALADGEEVTVSKP